MKTYIIRNIPEPWSVVCSKNDPIPNPLEANRYVIIKKSTFSEKGDQLENRDVIFIF